MDNIEKTLQELFDEMLTHVKGFRRKTYNGVFEKGYMKYRPVLVSLEQLLAETEDEEKDALIEKLSQVIPAYAYDKMQKEAKKNRERLGVDYNMNMAVYVIPFLNYSRNEYCEKLSRRIVEVWNEKKVTSLTLSHSSYDDIAEGFRSKLCYITTAVCEHMQKEDDCYEMQVMRRFRDEYLMQTDEGRSIIKDYYEVAPGIVMILNMQKDAAAIYKQLYCKYLLPCVQLIEQGKKAQCQALYMQMVQNLKMQYI